jgi:hypothetical protein
MCFLSSWIMIHRFGRLDKSPWLGFADFKQPTSLNTALIRGLRIISHAPKSTDLALRQLVAAWQMLSPAVAEMIMDVARRAI